MKSPSSNSGLRRALRKTAGPRFHCAVSCSAKLGSKTAMRSVPEVVAEVVHRGFLQFADASTHGGLLERGDAVPGERQRAFDDGVLERDFGVAARHYRGAADDAAVGDVHLAVAGGGNRDAVGL